MEKGVANVFVFETGSEFSTTGKKGRSSIDKDLQNYFITKVVFIISPLATVFGSSGAWKELLSYFSGMSFLLWPFRTST